MDYLDGLRKMFGLQPGQSIRGNQLEGQEQQVLQPQLRQAPVQPTVQPQVVPTTGVPAYDAAEAERSERQRLLEEALMQLRGGG